jgi:hypothetical protein
MWGRRRRAGVVLASALGLVAAGVGFVPATAAPAPPAVSQVRVEQRTDHTLTIKFAVPAAYYHPGAGVVVRLTRGRTPAASVVAGYAVTANAAHEAKAGPTLGAGLAYTFAIWIRDGGRYSRRVAITTTTLTDTTAPDPVTSLESRAAITASGPRVVLTWVDPCCDDLSYVRIVRNTTPTTTGGTVFNVGPNAKSFVDDDLPDSIVNNPTPFDFSDDPLYYYVIARDKAGNFSRSYVRTSVVVGSRTIEGQVSGSDRYVAVYCCPGETGELSLVTAQGGLGEDVDGGAFSVRVPPGVFTICEGDNLHANDPSATCWVDDAGAGGHTTPWAGYNEDVPPATIDLRTATSYDEVDFRRTTTN